MPAADFLAGAFAAGTKLDAMVRQKRGAQSGSGPAT